MTKRTGDSHSPKGRKTASHHEHHEHQAAIIDPPNHVAIPPPEIHHPALQRHAALKANALMSSVMAQARGAAASDTGPRQAQQPLVLQPTVLHAAPIGPADQEGIGLHVLAAGVIVQMYPWVPMAVGDLLELFWGTYPGGTVTASKLIAFPDEVNRPVLLPIPAGVIDAGWVNITCRVTHASTGFQNASPPRPLLVKLNPPGGIAPPPEVNHNLPPPILPPEIIDQGVDANQAARGVPVTIEPYPNMDDGDRIRLNWGGAYVVHTVTREQVNRPITIIVDDATIRSVGDGHALNVRYQVFDRVNNRSGWSPSAKVWVHVVPGALLPPQVTNADSDYRIHLSQLGGHPDRSPSPLWAQWPPCLSQASTKLPAGNWMQT